jgi:hypothetical protein
VAAFIRSLEPVISGSVLVGVCLWWCAVEDHAALRLNHRPARPRVWHHSLNAELPAVTDHENGFWRRVVCRPVSGLSPSELHSRTVLPSCSTPLSLHLLHVTRKGYRLHLKYCDAVLSGAGPLPQPDGPVQTDAEFQTRAGCE